MQLNVIYEDKDILVSFKPAGVATQTSKLSEPDMVSLIKNYLTKQGGGKSPYVGVIHRLDQPVSGLLVFAKNQKAAAVLSKQIQDGNANKDYLALCLGQFEKKEGTLIHYLGKDSVTRLAKVMDEDEFLHECKIEQTEDRKADVSYKKAVLVYEVKEESEDCSIVKVHLQTGRFHQIRAQFSFIGHPLLGDVKYGTQISHRVSMEKRIQKIALCAYELGLKHPTTGQEMNFRLDKKYLPTWYAV